MLDFVVFNSYMLHYTIQVSSPASKESPVSSCNCRRTNTGTCCSSSGQASILWDLYVLLFEITRCLIILVSRWCHREVISCNRRQFSHPEFHCSSHSKGRSSICTTKSKQCLSRSKWTWGREPWTTCTPCHPLMLLPFGSLTMDREASKTPPRPT